MPEPAETVLIREARAGAEVPDRSVSNRGSGREIKGTRGGAPSEGVLVRYRVGVGEPGSSEMGSGRESAESPASAVRHSPCSRTTGSDPAEGSGTIANSSLRNRMISRSGSSSSPVRRPRRARGVANAGTRHRTVVVEGGKSRVTRMGKLFPPSSERISSISTARKSVGSVQETSTLSPGWRSAPRWGLRNPSDAPAKDATAAIAIDPREILPRAAAAITVREL